MNKKRKVTYSEEDKELAYLSFSSYKLVQGQKTTKEVFDKFRYRKAFYELAKRYKDFNSSIPIEKYTEYIRENMVPVNRWTNLTTFRNFLMIYVKQEPCKIALERSIKYLSDNKTSIDKISDSRLIMYIEQGNVSPWLVLKEYPEFFEHINQNPGNLFCRNMLSYYFWKLKAQQEQLIDT